MTRNKENTMTEENTTPEGQEEGTPVADTPTVETPPEGDVAPAETPEEAVFQIGDEKFTATEVESALNMSKNQDSINTKNQEESARLNTLARVIEETRLGLSNQPVDTSVPANTKMTAEGFRDGLLGDNPSEAIAQMVNLINETVASKTGEVEAKNAFTTKYPDYNQVVNSSEYKTFISQDPMGQYLNDVNGFLSYKLSTTGNDVKIAETNGFKKGETQTMANIKAKGNLKVLNNDGGVSLPTKTQITSETPQGDVERGAVANLIAGRSG